MNVRVKSGIPSRRGGTTLFETVVALALIGIVGSTGAMSAIEMTRAVQQVQSGETRTREAAKLLAAVSLWPPEDLDRHLGSTKQGPMILWVDRSDLVMYRLTVTDMVTGRQLLTSAIYMPRPDR